MTGIHATKVAKSLNNKYSQKVLDSAIKSTTDAIKNASKKAIQKTAKATGDLISNKICAKITSISKSPTELHSNELHLKKMRMKQIYEKYISSEERQQFIYELKLV